MFSLRRQLTVDLVNEAVDPVRHAMFARQYVRSGTLLRLVGNESAFLGGIPGGENGDVITVLNDSGDYLKGLENENPKFRPEERLALPDSFPAFMMPNDTLSLMFDGTAQRWRVLSWPTRGQGMGLTYFDDADMSVGYYARQTSGTGAQVVESTDGIDGTSRAAGVLTLDTGTATTGRAAKAIGTGATTPIAPTLGAALLVARVRIPTAADGIDTFSAAIGFHDLMSGTLTDAVAWEYRLNGGSPEWSQTVAAATVAARSTVGSPAANSSWLWLVVFCSSTWDRADFLYSTNSIALTLAGSVSSGLPAVSNLVGPQIAIMKSAGATSRSMRNDLLGHRIQQVRA